MENETTQLPIKLGLMKAVGSMTRRKEAEFIGMWTGVSMKAIGKMIKGKGKGSIDSRMQITTKAIGKMTSAKEIE